VTDGPLFDEGETFDAAGDGPNEPLFADDDDAASYDDESADEVDSDGDDADSDSDGPDAFDDVKSAFPDLETEHASRCQPSPPPKKKAPPKKVCTVDTVKNNLKACDGGTNAWDAAKNGAGAEPTVQVKKTKSGFAAETSGTTITIAPTTNCCDATESLLFELHNVETTPDSAKIDDDAAKGNLSREDYTKGQEHIEYDGLKRSADVFKTCSKKWGCAAGAKSFASGFAKAKNFDDYYKNYLAKSHKDHYRKFWDKTYKAEYDKKHKKP
jgi:hypothetical protein